MPGDWLVNLFGSVLEGVGYIAGDLGAAVTRRGSHKVNVVATRLAIEETEGGGARLSLDVTLVSASRRTEQLSELRGVFTAEDGELATALWDDDSGVLSSLCFPARATTQAQWSAALSAEQCDQLRVFGADRFWTDGIDRSGRAHRFPAGIRHEGRWQAAPHGTWRDV